jgi:hypothetical protein
VGAGDLVFSNLPPGSHSLHLERRGYREKTLEVTIEPGIETELVPPASVLDRLTGSLQLKVEPAGAGIRIDPTSNVVDYDGPRELNEVPNRLTLPSGTYNLTFSATGYVSQIINVQLLDRETKPVHLTLAKR